MSDKKLRGGRFETAPDQLTRDFTESVSYDHRMYRQDIAGSIAHAGMLARRGVIEPGEAAALTEGLQRVRAEIEAGSFVWDPALEDLHMNIERRLTELVGEVGKKLHTGRSRNDQVALDFRLYVSERLDAWIRLALGLIRTLAEAAGKHRALLLPGYTHLQAAQPVSLAQHLLAYAWMLKRDVERMREARKRVRVSPLGAAALAGSVHPLDPASVAAELGLEEIFDNSMDAVSDRDFALEPMFCASLCMAHLSRLCEDIILWANANFSFVRLPDAYSTGSSIMPQKRNPDVAELVRGKTGKVYGALFSLLTTVKGLPMTYNRDLQEDKEAFFLADDTLGGCLEIMSGMLAALEFNAGNMRKALDRGYVNATELADYLAGKGIPFRDAHFITGRAVALAEERGLPLEALGLEEYRGLCREALGAESGFCALLGEELYALLAPEAAVARRLTPGGTGAESINAQLARLRAWLR